MHDDRFSRDSRRAFIRTAAGMAALSPFSNAFASALLAGDVTTGSGDHTYRVEHDWLVAPEGLAWGDTHGCAQDAAGNIYISHTVGGGATKDDAVYVFTKDGAFVRSMLPQMKGGGHGLDIRTEDGVEYLYHCDVNRRRVLKTKLDGTVMWEKGAPVEAEFAGAKVYANENDWNPTNVAFCPSGEIFVGDGYGKSFVHCFTKDGAYKETIIGPGNGEGQVACPHGLWWDDRVGTLAVADRSNRRIQYFAENGAGKPWKHASFVTESMRQPCHFKTRGDMLLVPDLSSAVELLGKDNKALAVLGDGHPTNLRGAARKDFIPGKFVHPHSAMFLADGSILVVEWVPIGRVTRLVKA
jgi:sugar lactone lactonase YvrE